MNRWKKRPVAFLVLVLFLLTATVAPAMDQADVDDSEVTTTAMIGDLLFLRPLGLAATIIGTFFFAVTIPFTATAGNTESAGEKLVKEPARFTFERPLGHLP